MVRPAHTLIQFEGTLGADGATKEQWSFAIRATGEPDVGEGNLNSPALAAAGAFATTLREEIGNNVALTKVTVAKVLASGHWATNPDGSWVKGTWEGVHRGMDATSPFVPYQVAVAFSLMSSRAGATGKGRFFVPIGRCGFLPDGRMEQPRAAALCAQGAEFISNLNAAVGTVEIVSSKGYTSPVTGVRVGRVPDTIRSRRRSLLEEYEIDLLP